MSRGKRLPPGAKTRGQSSDGLEPYFSLRPHDPASCVHPASPRPCPTCGGACKRERSLFVCMGCHSVAQSRERKYAQQRRDDELAVARVKAAAKAIKFAPKLTKKQRRSLIEDHGAAAVEWLNELDRTEA